MKAAAHHCHQYFLASLTAFWLLTASVYGGVSLQLQRFEQATTHTALHEANAFFDTLFARQIIDAPITYTALTPIDTLRQQVWYWAAEYYYDQQQYELAEQYGLKALPLYRTGNDRTGEADCLNILAISNFRLSDFEDAIHYAQLCYQLDSQSGDAERISSSLNSLAAIYMSANQPEEAKQYVLKGLETVGSNTARRSVLLGMASEVFHSLANDEQALNYAQQGYDLEIQLGNRHKAMIRLSQKAAALTGLMRYEEALEALQQSTVYFRQSDDRLSLAISYNRLGRLMLLTGREREAKTAYRQAAAIFKDIGDKTNEMHARKGLYECMWKSNPDSARLELNRFNQLKDSLYTNTSAKSLARYNAEFGNDWLKQENEAERTAKHNVMMVSVTVVLTLLLMAVLIWWLMRRRQMHQAAINQKLNKNIELLNEKYELLSHRYDQALMTQGENVEHEELSPGDRDFLERTIDVINELMLRGQIDAESVASQMNMSLFQLRQRLTALTGEKPQTFISMIRMKRARYLLSNQPELNISEVAQMCGYNDTPNFTRAFKKTFGITPTQYQERKEQFTQDR